MLKIEIGDNKCFNIPQSWDEVTVEQYEQIKGAPVETARDQIHLVEVLCRVSESELSDMPVEVFNFIVSAMQFLFTPDATTPSAFVEIGGVKYCVSNEQALTLGEWADVEDIQHNERANVSGVLAIICRPNGEKYDPDNFEERVAMFRELPVTKVLPVLAFFLRCKQTSEIRLKAYSEITAAAGLYVLDTVSSSVDGAITKRLPIWRRITYWLSTKSLHFLLRRCLTSLHISKIKQKQRFRKGNLKKG